MDYFSSCNAPTVYAVPDLSCFRLDGVGADGVEQGAGFFLGCYLGACEKLKGNYCYAIYSMCFSTSFAPIPHEAIYAEINHFIQPLHWVSI